jgi:alginate O-acetyltransferase complex protein AlgJ
MMETSGGAPSASWVERAPGFVLIGILGSALWTLRGLPAALEAPTAATLLDGRYTAATAATVDRELSFREESVALWAAAELALFGVGRPGVVVGREGWLFSTEELEPGAPNAPLILDLAQRASARLRAEGGSLVVVVLPDKLRVEAAQAGRFGSPPENAGRAAALRAALTAAEIRAPDVEGALVAAHGGSGGPLYFRTDTHWTPVGAQVAAGAIAAAVPELRGLARFTVEMAPEEAYAGDLLRFLPLGPFVALGPSPDRLAQPTTRRVAAPASAADLFGEVELPITLIGTSYSANPRWDFPGALSRAFGLEVLDLSVEGEGPIAPMRAWLSAPLEGGAPALVIWEVPERYLAVALPQPKAGA